MSSRMLRSGKPEEYDARESLQINGEEMGRGKYILVRHRRSQVLYFEKKYESTYERVSAAKQEVEIMLKAQDHIHINKVWDYFIDTEGVHASIWLDYCYEGTLSHLIKAHANQRVPVHERACSTFFQQIALAVDYLHRGNGAPDWQPIIHCDINPDIVWLKRLRPDWPPFVQLSGFGCAAWKNHPYLEEHQKGRREFWPPEYPNNDEHSDVYQLGQTMACLLTLSLGPPESLQDLEFKTGREHE
ncbi:kinase-like protein [Massarina eburnea CBS 473.64]|uniref:non-specific serine/threonine protein kinase n=1 Tax=Massarina eburnea CBS 473.64 TaxID=1395130 RepID=A0A6A6S3F3_9PLEO|nr:kinase-like protein [Massarina eburnea CBS 473.64]